ncbi:hypothetical protein D3C87_1868770 [compost metagenome]
MMSAVLPGLFFKYFTKKSTPDNEALVGLEELKSKYTFTYPPLINSSTVLFVTLSLPLPFLAYVLSK